MGSGRHRALLVGWAGGVGSALLRLLAAHPAGRPIAAGLDALFLLDERRDGVPPPSHLPVQVLPPASLDPAALGPLLAEHQIDQVIEVADVDTLAISAVCAHHGADYLSASMQRADAMTMVGARALLHEVRPDVRGASHLVATGMNPGVVNALALVGLEELGRRTERPASTDALDLYAIHVTETDTTEPLAGVPREAFPMSWSPRHALEEILEPAAMYMSAGRIARLPHRSHEHLYTVRCGADDIAAMVVPHEELVTLGARFPDVEAAFFYAVPPVAREALRRHPQRPPEAWDLHEMYPPSRVPVVGSDRVGVLLASRSHGELWIGFETDSREGMAYDTNATLLQAASGVLAGWRMLGHREGIHVVEELDPVEYLAIVESVLGPRRVHHAATAPVRSVQARRRPAPVSASPRSATTRAHR